MSARKMTTEEYLALMADRVSEIAAKLNAIQAILEKQEEVKNNLLSGAYDTEPVPAYVAPVNEIPVPTKAELIATEIEKNGYYLHNINLVECPTYPAMYPAGIDHTWVPINTICKDRQLWERVMIG